MKKSLSLLSCNATQKSTKKYWLGLRHYGCHGILFRTLPILMFFMLCFSSFAQNGIFVDSTANVFNTISRCNSAGNRQIHYVKTSDSTGIFLFQFNLRQSKSPMGTYKKIPISGYNVTDFVVVRDTIYMCGIKTGGRGFYAWMRLGSSPTSVQMKVYHLRDDTSFVTNPRRIQVFNSFSGTNVLLVGDLINPSNQFYIPTIVHVRGNTCYAAYLPGEYFDDIAVLNNYIVTSSRKGYNNPTNTSQLIRVTPKSILPLHSSLFKKYYHTKTPKTQSRVLLQHTDDNNFVTVYHNDYGFYINSLSVGSGGIPLISQYCTVDTTATNIFDVSYNIFDSTLMVIHSQSLHSTVSRFNCSLFPNISWIESYTPDVSVFCSGCMALTKSLCRNSSSSKFLVSGILDNHFMVWNTNGSCNLSQNIGTTIIQTGLNNYENQVIIDTIGVTNWTLSRPIQTHTVYGVCQ